LRQIDRGPHSLLHESLDLRQVIALVGQGLPRHREQLPVRHGIEERDAHLQDDLKVGGALLIGGRARAGLERPPAVAGLPEVPEELGKGHAGVEQVDAVPRGRHPRTGGDARPEEEVAGRPQVLRGARELRQQPGAGLLDAPLRGLRVSSSRAELRLALLGDALRLCERQHPSRRGLREKDG
jgi:hypothetical protein